MVHINNKYIKNNTGELDHDYLANADGIAVLGFLFDVAGSEVITIKLRIVFLVFCIVI